MCYNPTAPNLGVLDMEPISISKKNGVVIYRYSDGTSKVMSAPPISSHATEDTSQQIKPTLAELSLSAVDAMKSILVSGFDCVDEAERARRLTFCTVCQHLSDKKKCVHIVLPDGSVERGCGCYMPAKVNFAAMKCPIGKW